MVEMHTDRNMRIDFDDGVHHMLQHDVVGIGSGTSRRLHDHRCPNGIGRFHDGECLLHIIDIESRNAVAVFSGMIEQLPQGDPCHSTLSWS